MSRNTTLHLERVENAVRFLTRAPQATVPEAMRVARFSEDDIADPNIRKQILRRLPGRKKPTASSVSAALGPAIPPVGLVLGDAGRRRIVVVGLGGGRIVVQGSLLLDGPSRVSTDDA